MRFKKGNTCLCVLFILAIGLTGCAKPVKKSMVWPAKPDKPRIKFVRNFKTGQDVFGTSMTDQLLGAKGSSGMRKPMGIHYSKQGKLYVTDTAFSVVHVFDMVNKKKSILEGVSKPISVATDASGRAYVSDTTLDRVMMYDASGEFEASVGNPRELKQPSGVAINDRLGRIYIVDTHNHNVAVYSLNNRKRLFEFGKRGDGEGEFNFPSNVHVDKEDNVWIVDTINGRVQQFDADGNFISMFGRLGDAPGAFSRPKGIAQDSENHLYVVDSAFNNVQLFNPDGRILMSFGTYGSGRGGLILPSGVAISDDDRIFVVDQWNARIAEFQYLSEEYQKANPEEMKLLQKGVLFTEDDYRQESEHDK